MGTLTAQSLAAIKAAVDADRIREQEPMKAHTTMEVGGPADWFFTPANTEELALILKYLKADEVPYYILGNGSNVICRDAGYRGAVICLNERFSGYEIREDREETVLVAVRAGMQNKEFSDAMIREGLAGFEFASGIPGSIGGATAMNAGAYDGELKQIVEEVTLLDPELKVVRKSGAEMEFGYRHSLVSDGEYIVLETVFALRREDPAAIQERVDDLTRRREEKQPLEYPSCGSTFKRPEGYFAGKLISDAGLKGYRLGGAQVSEKHAGFVINRDHASAQDVLDLIAYIQKTVQESQGVQLECEVKILG